MAGLSCLLLDELDDELDDELRELEELRLERD